MISGRIPSIRHPVSFEACALVGVYGDPSRGGSLPVQPRAVTARRHPQANAARCDGMPGCRVLERSSVASGLAGLRSHRASGHRR